MTKTAEELSEAFGYLTLPEVAFLKELVRSLPDNPTVINIGAGSGTSGVAIIEARDDSRLVTVDIFGGGRPQGGLVNELNAFRNAGISSDRYRQIQGNSPLVGQNWESANFGEKINPDMVFVDGNHSYEGCRADIAAWLPLTAQIIAFHDFESANWPGVVQAVLDYFEEDDAIGLADSLIAFNVGS